MLGYLIKQQCINNTWLNLSVVKTCNYPCSPNLKDGKKGQNLEQCKTYSLHLNFTLLLCNLLIGEAVIFSCCSCHSTAPRPHANFEVVMSQQSLINSNMWLWGVKCQFGAIEPASPTGKLHMTVYLKLFSDGFV